MDFTAIWAAVAAIGTVGTGGIAALSSRQSRLSANESNAAAKESTAAAKEASAAAEALAAIEADRRHSELTPRFRVICEPSNPGADTLTLRVILAGPPGLHHLDGVTVRIRDDYFRRGDGQLTAGGPSREEIKAHIWGPYRFRPHTGPDEGRADDTGRVTPMSIIRCRWARNCCTFSNRRGHRGGPHGVHRIGGGRSATSSASRSKPATTCTGHGPCRVRSMSVTVGKPVTITVL